MGVVTGTFQYANGSPVANAAYQWKLSSDAIEFSGTTACICPPIVNGSLDANGLMTTTFAFNDVLSTTAGATTYYQLSVKAQNGGQVWNEYYYLTGSTANLNLIPPAGIPIIVTTPVGSVLLQTDSVTNANQSKLNQLSGPGVLLGADTAGGVTFAANLVAGTNITLSTSTANAITINSQTGLPASPEVGDTIRYNLYGNNSWNATNLAAPFVGIYAVNQQISLQAVGILGTGSAAVTGSRTTINPTQTLGAGLSTSAAATGSLNTVIGTAFGSNGSVSLTGITSFYRYSAKMSFGNVSTNARYWLGLGNVGGPTGANPTAIVGTTAYATDTPNKTTIGFRFSTGTDTTWQAVVIKAGASSGSQSTADTHVTPDTNVHLYEMTCDSAGAVIDFYIDGVFVASINTNIPQAASTSDSWGNLFFTGDNKNQNTAVSAGFYSMSVSLRL